MGIEREDDDSWSWYIVYLFVYPNKFPSARVRKKFYFLGTYRLDRSFCSSSTSSWSKSIIIIFSFFLSDVYHRSGISQTANRRKCTTKFFPLFGNKQVHKRETLVEPSMVQKMKNERTNVIDCVDRGRSERQSIVLHKSKDCPAQLELDCATSRGLLNWGRKSLVENIFNLSLFTLVHLNFANPFLSLYFLIDFLIFAEFSWNKDNLWLVKVTCPSFTVDHHPNPYHRIVCKNITKNLTIIGAIVNPSEYSIDLFQRQLLELFGHFLVLFPMRCPFYHSTFFLLPYGALCLYQRAYLSSVDLSAPIFIIHGKRPNCKGDRENWRTRKRERETARGSSINLPQTHGRSSCDRRLALNHTQVQRR